ncbi:ABC transporter B family member 26 [Hibiscus syriacus]|uniref:ABC transporter B family member 26 n=1 Tax=Hibiscus syriacus TaxID=106335 RepID=A0A6A3BWK4_HIBSY|nr:ABC transporter B family member 26 [Hibiscus syriacus]
MALLLCCNARLDPCRRVLSHYDRRFHFVNRRTLRFSRRGDVSICSRRINHRLPPLNSSSSVNGFLLETNLEHFKEEHTVESVELRDRFRKWIDFLRSVLPGGSWWSFSDEVEVNFLAKPVTVWRALTRMWQLIANDRLVIFAAFSTLIVAAVKRTRETLYSALLLQDISFFDGETVGDLTSRLGSDCQQVSRVIGNDLNLILRNVLQGTGALIYLLVLSWPLGLCTLVICCSLAAVMTVYGLYQKKTAKMIQEFGASGNEVAQETLSLMRTVRVYGTEKKEMKRYNHFLDKLAEISLRQSAAYGIWNLTFNTLYHATQVIAVLVGGMYILAGHITAEKLTKFILYSEWLIYSTWWIGDNVSSLMQSVGASEKVPVLRHINLSVHPGEVVALVGLSGSGKSTIVNLLLRLYEPTNGQILIDGVPLNELDIKWLRGKIGYVGQEPKLFRMDISSNIKYGCTRNIKQEDVEWAAKQAYAHDFITLLPDGDPTILILDEATSALDAESEHNTKGVLRSVRSDLSSKRTVVVIAHRLSTIQAADRIVVMDRGQIVETGSHNELLQKDGLYARLTRRQTDALTKVYNHPTRIHCLLEPGEGYQQNKGITKLFSLCYYLSQQPAGDLNGERRRYTLGSETNLRARLRMICGIAMAKRQREDSGKLMWVFLYFLNLARRPTCSQIQQLFHQKRPVASRPIGSDRIRSRAL